MEKLLQVLLIFGIGEILILFILGLKIENLGRKIDRLISRR